MNPPKLARWLVDHLLPHDVRGDAMRGDLLEEFRARTGVRASLWYWRHALSVCARYARSRHLDSSFTRAKQPEDFGRGGLMMRIATTTERLYRDLRLATRALLARRMWSAAALACLAIAMGSSTAAFTIVRGLFFGPLPFPDARQLVMVAVSERGKGPRPFSFAQYEALTQPGSNAIELLARSYADVSITTHGEPESTGAEAEIVSPNYFQTLRVTPFAGEFFAVGRHDEEPVAVLSYRLWSQRFHGDITAIGSNLKVGGLTARVVGIAAPDFVGATSLIASDLWLPLSQYAAITGESPQSITGESTQSGPLLTVMGRLPHGMTTEQAEAQLTTRLAVEDSANRTKDAVLIRPASGFGVPIALQGPVLAVSTFIYIILTLLMAVACANVAALVLARSATQWRDVAIRRSLGASFARIASQSLAEAFVLSAAGAAIGGLLATWLTTYAARRLESPFGYVSFALNLKPDAEVFAFAVLGGLIATLWCSVAPLWIGSRIDVRECLGTAGRGHTPSSHRIFNTIIAAQFATSAVLLIVAAQIVHGYIRSAGAFLPYDAAHVAAITIDYGHVSGLDAAQSGSLYDDIQRQALRVPGVSGVSAVSALPLTPAPLVTVFKGDKPSSRAESGAAAGLLWVGPSYFATLGVQLLGGRDFSRADGFDDRSVIVNDALGRRLWPSANPIGQSIRIDDSDHSQILEVVGVVPNVNEENPSAAAKPMLYRATQDLRGRHLYLLARVETPTATMFESLRRSLESGTPSVNAIDVKTLEQWVESVKDQKRMPTIGLMAVGILGLILSVIGVYGVVSYHVRERRREIGVRLALGASSVAVVRQVLGHGLQPVVYGLIVGLAGAVAAGALLRNRVYGVGLPLLGDAVGIFVLLVTVASCALYWPARCASRIPPSESLRTD
ncbi:MAG: ABC transporter permease [Vicinamibacterales bacterium]